MLDYLVMAIMFDRLKFANTLKAAGVSAEIAEAQTKAEAEALADLITTQLATKADLNQLRNELIIKLGGIMVTGVGLLAALLAIFHS